MQGKTDLFDVIDALHPSCGFPCGLHSRKQKSNQYADDGNDDEEFD
jgi:hypothetical protein